MNLDQRIRFEEQNAANGCPENAQLIEWLKELKKLRRKVKDKEIVRKIVDEIFNGADGKPVRRLVLEPMDKHLNEAGWCHAAICDIIHKHLKETK